MYQMNDLELWNQRRHDLLKEAEVGRLARMLRAMRPKRGPRSRSTLSARTIEAPAHLCVEDGGRA